MQKHRKSLPNGRQQEPQGGGAKRRPLRFCCCPFVKDFLRFLLGLSLKNELAHNKAQRGAREARAPLGRRRRWSLVVFIISACFSLFFLSNFLDFGWAWQDFLDRSWFRADFSLFCPWYQGKGMKKT